jgi:hypothetical protein
MPSSWFDGDDPTQPSADTSFTPTNADALDRTETQPGSTVRPRRTMVDRYANEEAFQSLRSHLAVLGEALAIAVVAGLAIFIGVGTLRHLFDEDTWWQSVRHSIAQFWYVLMVFVAVAVPPALVLLRRGWSHMVGFVIDRNYWKVVVVVYAVVPVVTGVITFVLGNLLATLVLGLLVVMVVVVLVANGGF